MSTPTPWAELLGDWDPLPMLAGWLAGRGYTATALVREWDELVESENPFILNMHAGKMAQIREAIAQAATRARWQRVFPDQLDDLILPMLRAEAAREANRGRKPGAGAVDGGGERDHGGGVGDVVRGGVADDSVAAESDRPASFADIVKQDGGDPDDLRF